MTLGEYGIDINFSVGTITARLRYRTYRKIRITGR
jgi:hypothetical protein